MRKKVLALLPTAALMLLASCTPTDSSLSNDITVTQPETGISTGESLPDSSKEESSDSSNSAAEEPVQYDLTQEMLNQFSTGWSASLIETISDGVSNYSAYNDIKLGKDSFRSDIYESVAYPETPTKDKLTDTVTYTRYDIEDQSIISIPQLHSDNTLSYSPVGIQTGETISALKYDGNLSSFFGELTVEDFTRTGDTNQFVLDTSKVSEQTLKAMALQLTGVLTLDTTGLAMTLDSFGLFVDENGIEGLYAYTAPYTQYDTKVTYEIYSDSLVAGEPEIELPTPLTGTPDEDLANAFASLKSGDWTMTEKVTTPVGTSEEKSESTVYADKDSENIHYTDGTYDYVYYKQEDGYIDGFKLNGQWLYSTDDTKTEASYASILPLFDISPLFFDKNEQGQYVFNASYGVLPNAYEIDFFQSNLLLDDLTIALGTDTIEIIAHAQVFNSANALVSQTIEMTYSDIGETTIAESSLAGIENIRQADLNDTIALFDYSTDDGYEGLVSQLVGDKTEDFAKVASLLPTKPMQGVPGSASLPSKDNPEESATYYGVLYPYDTDEDCQDLISFFFNQGYKNGEMTEEDIFNSIDATGSASLASTKTVELDTGLVSLEVTIYSVADSYGNFALLVVPFSVTQA